MFSQSLKLSSVKGWLKNGKKRLIVLGYLIKSGQSIRLIYFQIKRFFFHFFLYPLSKIFPRKITINFKKANSLLLFFSSPAIKKIKIPFNDLLFYEIYLENAYHSEILKNGMIVVDVGAHKGFYSLIAAEKAGKDGKVIAIEPELKNYKALLRNIKLNNFTNILPVNLGLSDHNGFEKLYLRSSSTDHSFFKKSENEDFINVKVKSLDSLLEELGYERIDVLKIDTEGAELLILKGAQRTLEKNPHLKLFIASYHYPEEAEEVTQFLLTKHFKSKISKNGIVMNI